MKKLPLLVAGLAATAIGAAGVGTAFASAPSLSRVPAVHALAPTTAMDSTSATDTDNVQQGAQSGPDTAGGKDTEKASSEKASSEKAGTEKAGTESAAASDGPGGYADSATGNANTQQEGEH